MFTKALLETRLDSDIPQGPQGQPAHKKGARVAFMRESKSTVFGKLYYIPPNPVLLILNHANELKNSRKQYFKKCRKDIESKLFAGQATSNYQEIRSIRNYRNICKFIEKSVLLPICLFTSIEAFCNQMIPEDYVFTYKNGKSNNKTEIEKGIKTDEKLKIIMTDIFSKDISKDSLIWQNFMDIKAIRDNSVHLKTSKENNYNWYEDIFANLIDYNADKFYHNTLKLIKFYKKNYFY